LPDQGDGMLQSALEQYGLQGPQYTELVAILEGSGSPPNYGNFYIPKNIKAGLASASPKVESACAKAR